MKVLLIGVGGVGEAIAVVARDRPWLEKMVLADYNLERASKIQKSLHEEVVLIPRYIPCKRVTFKYGLGEKFINVIKVIKMLGLHRKELVDVKGVKVSPIEVVAACLPDPASLGDKMNGKTCVGTWVTGVKDGKYREVYIYQVTDNQESMRKYGCQAVSL